MKEYTEKFIKEADEILVKLEESLLLLEKDSQNTELIHEIFRHMHTLKGTGGMFGFSEVERLTHEYENIYDKVRNGEQKITGELIEASLRGVDMLKLMLRNEENTDEVDELINRLKREFCKDDRLVRKEKGTEAETVHEPQSNDKYFCILFTPDTGIFERGLDPDYALSDIEELGITFMKLHEGDTSWKEQRENKVCNTSWEIYLYTSKSKDDIEDILLFYAKDEYKVFELNEEAKSPGGDYNKFIKKHYAKVSGGSKAHFQRCIEELNARIDQNVSDKEGTDEQETTEKAAGSNKLHEKDKKVHSMETTINVSSSKLDELLNLVSELVSSSAALESHAERIHDVSLHTTIEGIEKLTKKFRDNALELRLIPVGSLLNKFHRQVRDLSKELDKEVNLIIEGQDTEIDKTILRSIESPMLHIIRNSIDHGLEGSDERKKAGKNPAGTLKIVASYSGANVIIQVQDDGRGIDLEKVRKTAVKLGYIQSDQQTTDQELLNLIVEPGFSTSEKISRVSGRGVGMDVVKKELSDVSGTLEIFTEKGLGTSITLKLPTTLSIIDTLRIQVAQTQFLLPLLDVEYCYKENVKNLYSQHNRHLKYKDELVPFIVLRDKLKLPEKQNDEETVIIINKFEEKFALVVDQIIGEHQAVIKPLGELFVHQPYFSGGSIMVDGNLALILDTNYLRNQKSLN
jgi:two-component system, chemotaxis family, sensor kinase CheA